MESLKLDLCYAIIITGMPHGSLRLWKQKGTNFFIRKENFYETEK